MAGGLNIKAAPVGLTPVAVEQLLGWMDARRAIPRVIGVDLASGADRCCEVTLTDGRIVGVRDLEPRLG